MSTYVCKDECFCEVNFRAIGNEICERTVDPVLCSCFFVIGRSYHLLVLKNFMNDWLWLCITCRLCGLRSMYNWLYNNGLWSGALLSIPYTNHTLCLFGVSKKSPVQHPITLITFDLHDGGEFIHHKFPLHLTVLQTFFDEFWNFLSVNLSWSSFEFWSFFVLSLIIIRYRSICGIAGSWPQHSYVLSSCNL